MYVESVAALRGMKLTCWENLLKKTALTPDLHWEQTVLIWDGEDLIAAGSRQDNLLKCIAVDPARQGEGLLSGVITALRQEAFRKGLRHLFLYTKPSNAYLFGPLFFYPVAQTGDVLLMEDRKNGIRDFLEALPAETYTGTVGAAVMNCNPFTLGHKYLIRQAAGECDNLYVFVLSEDKSAFSAETRLELVKRGTADIPNVTVLPTGPYLISSATFPTYFLKNREQGGQVQCLLDVEIFCKYFAPRLGITRRYVGTEPLSPMTNQYNETLKDCLPGRGIELREIPRLEKNGTPVSASAVRALWENGDWEALRSLVPETTLAWLEENKK